MVVSYVLGRKESVADLRDVIVTLHKEMTVALAELSEFQEAGSAVHSLRAELHSLHARLERKVSKKALPYHMCRSYM